MASIVHCSQHGASYILASIVHCSQHGASYILASTVHCPQDVARYILASIVLVSSMKLENSGQYCPLFPAWS